MSSVCVEDDTESQKAFSSLFFPLFLNTGEVMLEQL